MGSEPLFDLLGKNELYFKYDIVYINHIQNYQGDLYVNGYDLRTFLTTVNSAANDFILQFRKDLNQSTNKFLFLNTQLNFVLSNLNEALDFNYKIINNKHKIKTISITGSLPDTTHYKYYGELNENYQKLYSDYFETVQDALLKIFNSLTLTNIPETQPTSAPNVPDFKKVKLNLSVGELGLLSKLLVQEKIIKTESVEEVFRIINYFFSAKKSDDISEKSLHKKFYNSDTRTTNNVKALLSNLKTRLQK